MPEYEQLVKKLMEQRPDVAIDQIDKMVAEKKQRIGAGYLTDQGALFLIAADLGVKLEEPVGTQVKIADLFAGSKEVSVLAKVLNVASPRQHMRKDGTPFTLRMMAVYDENKSIEVKLWDDRATLPVLDTLKPGDLVNITRAYVKSNLDGSLNLNIGSNSDISRADEENSIPGVDSLAKDISKIQESDRNAVVMGVLDGMVSAMSFTNKRGEQSSALKMSLRGEDAKSYRVVLWGKSEKDIPKIILPDAQVKLIGVNAKNGMQGQEVHGNEATILGIDGQDDVEPLVCRVISMVSGFDNRSDEGESRFVVATDRNRNLFSIVDSGNRMQDVNDGDVVEVLPSKAHGNSIWLEEDSLVRRMEDDAAIPNADEIKTRIGDIEAGKNVCVHVILLQNNEPKEIQTKTGDTIMLSEVLVEDGASVWIKAWRNQARSFEQYKPGTMLKITGLNARMNYEGRIDLHLSKFSKITATDEP